MPLSRFAIEEAIELNGAEKSNNLKAFALGRALYLGRIASPKAETAFDVEAFIARRIADLSAYQDAAYAAQYEALIDAVRKVGSAALLEAVARNAFKLMAYKDEYEVARLYADPAFRERLAAQFDNPQKLSVFLAPPLLARKNPVTGEPQKMKFGGWVFGAFGVLKGLKGLRGTVFDPFGHTHERRMERRLRDDYLRLVRDLIAQVQPHNMAQAVAIARLPEDIRGFGHIKAASVETYEAQKTVKLAEFAAAKPAQKSQSQKEPVHV